MLFRNFHIAALLILLTFNTAGTVFASDSDAGSATLLTGGPIFDFRASPSVDYSSFHLFGPIIKRERKADETDLALRPLFYRSTAERRNASLTYLLFPLLKARTDENSFSCSVLGLLNYASQDDADRDVTDFTLFPLVFYRKPADRPTTLSVFPIGGRISDRLGRDDIRFALWPMYVSTRKGHTLVDNYLWPFFAVVHGDSPEEKGVKVWPLFGRAHFPGHYRKFFLLWPFWFDYDERLETENPVAKRYAFPFYLYSESPLMSRRTVLWPFFSYLDDRGKGYTEWNFPWPLWQHAKGDFKHGWKFLPVYADMTRNDMRTRWYLWPLLKHENQHYEEVSRTRTRVLFFLYRDLRETFRATGEERSRRTMLWPLFKYQKRQGVAQVSLLALLEPFFPESDGVELNWAPLWRIYQRKWDAQGNSVTSVFWNLYWSERRPGAAARELFPILSTYRDDGVRRWSFLKGLIGFENDHGKRRLKLVYLPWGIPLGSDEAERSVPE